MIYAITKYLVIGYFVVAALFGGYIYAKTKSFEFAASLLANGYTRNKALSGVERAVLRGVRFLRISVIASAVVLFLVELIRLIRY